LSVSEYDVLLALARRAGCAELLIGFESPIEQGLDGIELRRNWKKRTWPIYTQVIQRIQSYGIRVNACFVLGLDGHTPDIFDAVYEFVEDTTPFDVQITYQTSFPNTPLYHRLKKQGRLTHDGRWERCALFDTNYEPQPTSAAQLRRGFDGLSHVCTATHSRNDIGRSSGRSIGAPSQRGQTAPTWGSASGRCACRSCGNALT